MAGVDILARENATILNAAILRFAKRTINGFRRAMKTLDLQCPLYLTSNSGQLLSAQEATSYPIQIFSSGVTNSIRGASFLSTASQSKESRYVVDIGGTTTDIGCLLPSGFPRLAGATTEVGGVKVNFAMPQVESIGLGGGSIVHEHSNGKVTLGPDSVGNALREKAQCFGGSTLTSTDIMVAAGVAKIGHASLDTPSSIVSAARLKMKIMIENLIDRMKTSPEPCHLLLVGGGAFLCPDKLDGVASIETPEHANVANAIGAAVAEIGQSAEIIVDASKKDSMLDELKERTTAQAIARGAKEGLVRIIEEDVAGVAAIEGKFKITVKVVGPLDYERFLDVTATANENLEPMEDLTYQETKLSILSDEDSQNTNDDTSINHATYRPHIDSKRVWHLSQTDAYYISIGCYILGCAGGGTPYGPYLQTRQLLREGGSIKIVDIEDLPDDTLCGPVAAMGSPVIALERLGGDMISHAMKGMQDFLKIKFTATMTAEIGGANGLAPLLLASSQGMDIPCVDADLMGKCKVLGITPVSIGPERPLIWSKSYVKLKNVLDWKHVAFLYFQSYSPSRSYMT